MKKLFKHFHRKPLKEDFRKLGINLITASIVGGFITHVVILSKLANVSIGGVWLLGVIIFLYGLHKFDAN